MKTKPLSEKKLLDKIAHLETIIVNFETKMRNWESIIGSAEEHFASNDKVQGVEDHIWRLEKTLVKINYRLMGIVEKGIKKE